MSDNASDVPRQFEEATITVASAELMSAQPELHHYTTIGGLSGIIASRSMWATHYKALNDSKEVVLLREPLTAAVTDRHREILRERQRASLRIRRAIEKSGGLLAASKHVAEDLVNSLYQTSFDNRPDGPGLAEPFIASFCGHPVDSYESEHGLLSQWRGYGAGGGYCIVFDTAGLAQLLGQEFDAHFYVHLNMDRAIYGDKSAVIDQLFPDLIGRCDAFLTDILENNSLDLAVEQGFAPFISGTTLFKHQGFREENEVRVVAVPASTEMRAQLVKENPDKQIAPAKLVSAPDEARRERRHIALFEGLNQSLPIRRVIVGPSADQAANAETAAALLGADIPVYRSETPFIG